VIRDVNQEFRDGLWNSTSTVEAPFQSVLQVDFNQKGDYNLIEVAKSLTGPIMADINNCDSTFSRYRNGAPKQKRESRNKSQCYYQEGS